MSIAQMEIQLPALVCLSCFKTCPELSIRSFARNFVSGQHSILLSLQLRRLRQHLII